MVDVADGPRTVRALACLAAVAMGAVLAGVARRRWYGPRRLDRLARRLGRAALYGFAATGATAVAQLGWSALAEEPVVYGSWTVGLAVAAAVWGGLFSRDEGGGASAPLLGRAASGKSPRTLVEPEAPMQLTA